MWKRDVIHKAEVHNITCRTAVKRRPISQSHYRQADATCTENVKFGRVVFDIAYAGGHTRADRHTSPTYRDDHEINLERLTKVNST